MRITYLLLSDTFGMHQYTADYANRMALAEHEVALVTTRHYPADRYLPEVRVEMPVATRGTGLSRQALDPRGFARLMATLSRMEPDLVHVTGPHLWNPCVLAALRRRGLPTVHTIHDVDPHPDAAYGRLLYLWNRAVLRRADVVLVHGREYADRLRRNGACKGDVAYLPLLHLFLGRRWWQDPSAMTPEIRYEPLVLFFGRLKPYKGIAHLLRAWQRLPEAVRDAAQLVLAGSGRLSDCWSGDLPRGVAVRARLVPEEEALDLFARCTVLVLPYVGATQSALVGAAYYHRKPVIVSPSGALAEYVEEGRTGWVLSPEDHEAWARRLAELLQNPDLAREMGSRGRTWYEEQRRREWDGLQEMYEHVAHHVGRKETDGG